MVEEQIDLTKEEQMGELDHFQREAIEDFREDLKKIPWRCMGFYET